MSKCLIFILSVYYAVGLPAAAVEYSAGITQAYWESKSSKMACDLIQSIPNYGQAFFSIRPEQALQFGIYQTNKSGHEVSEANLSATPAPWKHEFTHLKIYPVYLEQSAQSQYLSVFGVDAEAMIEVLLSAEFPTFTYISTHSERERENIRVSVSAVNFSQEYKKFAACRQQLSLYALSSLQDQVIYFAENDLRINAKASAQLDKVVNYLQDVSGAHLVLASDTYNLGKRDTKYFTPRAQQLIDTLVKKGIHKSRIAVRPAFLPQDRQSKGEIIRIHLFAPDSLKWFRYRKGSAHLTTKEKQQLDLVSSYMKQQSSPLVINSHTDFVEGGVNNRSIAQKRGNNIKRYLRSQGIAAEKLIVRVHGKKNPIASNRTREGQARNRRVELSFTQ